MLLAISFGLSGCASAVEEASASDMPLPSGVRPFTEAISLRYGGFERFTYTFRSDIEPPGTGRRIIAEGWVMEGTMRPQGEEAEWSYRLSNIGRDGVLRERGALQVRTDPWGEVRAARVLADRAAPGSARPRGSADWLFSEQDLRFPLCCCPRGPIRMGDAITLPRGSETMPGTLSAQSPQPVPETAMEMARGMQSVAAGLLDQGGRRYLVVRHTGHARAAGPEGAAIIRSSGYSLIDTQTCLPRRSTWVNSVEMEGVSRARPFSIIHTHEARF